MENTSQIFQFGPFSVDPGSGTLTAHGRPTQIAPKLYDALLILLENQGKLVNRETLSTKLFEDEEPEDNSITRLISRLREALDDVPDQSNRYKYIETVPRRGYRFIGVIEEPIRTIAVLPFRSLEQSKENTTFGVGLADLLIAKIGSIREVSVRATYSIMKYSGKIQNPQAAGRELNVDVVLEGTFYRSADRIHATAHLVRVRDGKQLWSGLFDENFSNIFNVVNSISDQVVSAFTDKLSSVEQKKISNNETENSEAYQYYLKGRYHLTKRFPNGIIKGISNFQKAIELDANYAAAYAGLADCYANASVYAGRSPAETFPNARHAALKALELDNNLAEAHAVLGLISLDYDWNWESAEKNLKTAISLKTTLLDARKWYAWLLIILKRNKEAIEQIKEAQKYDSISASANGDLAMHFYLLGQSDQALRQTELALELQPNFIIAHLIKGLVLLSRNELQQASHIFKSVSEATGQRFDYALALWSLSLGREGKKREAEKILGRLQMEMELVYVNPLSLVLCNIGIGNLDAAFDWLEQAFEDRAWGMIQIGVDPVFRALAGHQKFSEILKKMSLPANK